jgi:hypothetical protein
LQAHLQFICVGCSAVSLFTHYLLDQKKEIAVFFDVPVPKNEPLNSYAPGTNERALLKAKLDEHWREIYGNSRDNKRNEVFIAATPLICIEPHEPSVTSSQNTTFDE